MAALVNNLRKQLDLPTWEWMRFAPAISATASTTCHAPNSQYHAQHGQYIYYLIGATAFWRYDTFADSYVQLSSPPIAIATWASMSFAGTTGIQRYVLSATTNTVTVPGYGHGAYTGFDIKIIAGTGAGQARTVISVADPAIADLGVATGVNNVLGALTITDTTKAWAFNQWAGYQLRITDGSGVGQVLLILANTATVLVLGDSTMSPHQNNCNPMIFAPAISATAGVQSDYAIESHVATVDSVWTTIPDTTSVFIIESGTIWLVSSAAATPFYTLQQYDIVTDRWYIKTANTLNVPVVGTDGFVERGTLEMSTWAMGLAASATSTTITDTTANWNVNQWVGKWVHIFTGAGVGQIRQILSNTATQLTWTTVMTVVPDATSQYKIDGFDAGTAASGTSTTLVDSTKAWTTNQWSNFAVKILYGTGAGQVVPIASNTATTLTINRSAWLTNPDSTSIYIIIPDNDKIYIGLGGSAGILIHNVKADMASLARPIDDGTARICSASVGVEGQSTVRKAIGVTTLANATTTATATTAVPHNFKAGQLVTVRGATDANFNVTGVAILDCPSATTFRYVMAGTPAGTTIAGTALSTSVLTDVTKAWTVNQFAGMVCYFLSSVVTAASGLASGLCAEIASNTATALTFKAAASSAPLNGVSRYLICPRNAIGGIENGIATGSQLTTQLQDTNKAGTFTGSIPSGSNVMTVSTTPVGSLSNGMSVATTGIPAGTVILYQLTGTLGGQGTYLLSMNATALVSAATITYGWVVNIFAGKRLKMIGATGQAQEVTISSNTNNALTFGAVTAPVTLATPYVIVEQLVIGPGTNGLLACGATEAGVGGRYVFIARGGANFGFNRWDITTDRISLMPVSPQIETLTTASMYAYDGGDRIYFTKEITQRVYYIDIRTGTIHGAGQYPYLAGTSILGNRMEIFTTADGLKFLWLNRHANQECFRTLLFY